MRSRLMFSLSLSAAMCLGLGSGVSLLAQDNTMPPAQDGQMQQHQWHGRGPMSPQDELQHMTKMLELSSDQQAQLLPILQSRHDQLMQIHQDSSLSRQDKMSKMQALDQDSNSKVEAVLNDQQKAKYEKMLERRKEHREQMMQNGGGNGGAQPQ